MTEDQNQLPLWGVAVAEPDPNVPFLISVLQDRDWMHANEVAAEIFRRVSLQWSDRKVRDVAAAAAPKVISGQLGYKLTAHATPEEIHHFASWMEAQGKKMFARAEGVRRFAHQQIGKAAVK